MSTLPQDLIALGIDRKLKNSKPDFRGEEPDFAASAK
jgi:hypothetical protein